MVDRETVSLDEIESRLRRTGDPRVHAALVCAARSCPPLRHEAYTAVRLEQQLDENTREWLADRDLNEFVPEQHLARVSSIFQWYKGDFESGGRTLWSFLARYAPNESARRGGEWKIEYKSYRWGLNDASNLGAEYSGLRFYWDYLRNK